jgi:hypothetical protein
LKSAHQDDLKISKTYYFKAKKKRKFKFFEKCFPTAMPNALADHMKRIEAKVERYEQHAESSCHEEGMM